MAGFGISSVEPLGPTTTVLRVSVVYSDLSFQLVIYLESVSIAEVDGTSLADLRGGPHP
jgi:hypothetical protein